MPKTNDLRAMLNQPPFLNLDSQSVSYVINASSPQLSFNFTMRPEDDNFQLKYMNITSSDFGKITYYYNDTTQRPELQTYSSPGEMMRYDLDSNMLLI